MNNKNTAGLIVDAQADLLLIFLQNACSLMMVELILLDDKILLQIGLGEKGEFPRKKYLFSGFSSNHHTGFSYLLYLFGPSLTPVFSYRR